MRKRNASRDVVGRVEIRDRPSDVPLSHYIRAAVRLELRIPGQSRFAQASTARRVKIVAAPGISGSIELGHRRLDKLCGMREASLEERERIHEPDQTMPLQVQFREPVFRCNRIVLLLKRRLSYN